MRGLEIPSAGFPAAMNVGFGYDKYLGDVPPGRLYGG